MGREKLVIPCQVAGDLEELVGLANPHTALCLPSLPPSRFPISLPLRVSMRAHVCVHTCTHM